MGTDPTTPRPGISLDEWYPLIETVVPTPRTVVLHSVDMAPLAYGPDPSAPNVEADFRDLCERIVEAGNGLGWPVFLRTGQGSGKHEWRDTCFVPDASAVWAHVSRLVEWSEMADMMGFPSDVWVVREMVPVLSSFHAFEGFPVSRERRYFVDDGKVVGHHPYWPPDAIEYGTDADDWRERLAFLNAETPAEIAELSALTEKVGAVVPGAWSVDWLWSPGRGWLCIDMAHAERSFVWADYPTAPKFAEVSA